MLASCLKDIIDDVEFTALYGENISRRVFPYSKYDKFNLDDRDEAECQVELRFGISDLALLLHALRFPIIIFFLRELPVLEWKAFLFC